MRIALGVVAASLAACEVDHKGDQDHTVELGPTFECVDRPEDMTGYLQPICRYLADTYGHYDVDPNTLTIRYVMPGDQFSSAQPPTNTAEYDYVFLSCCYTGDVSIVRRATHEVVDFWFGAI